MLLVNHPDTYKAERAYVLDIILGERLGLDWEGRPERRENTEITAPSLADDRRLVLTEGLFTTPERDWLSENSLPKRPLAHWSLAHAPIEPTVVAPTLPVIYGRALADGSFCTATPAALTLGLDVLGSVFFQLSRYEEIANTTRDEHDRFPALASLALGEGFLERPLADEYVEILWAALERLWPGLRRRRSSPSERLSHDVDWPLYPLISQRQAVRTAIGRVLRGPDRGAAGVSLRAARSRRDDIATNDPYDTFDQIMDLSEQHGLRSAFYFMAGCTNRRFDSGYSLDDPWIEALIKRIHERGHELGLHPSYETFRSPAAIDREREELVRACERLGVEQDEWGGRQHYLRWENPTTWRGWEQAGLAYDSSLGFSHDPGFRCGTCHEHPVFDLLAQQRLRLRERPLVAMEMAVIDGEAGSGRPPSDHVALATIERLRERSRMFGGEFTLLWHNSRLSSRREQRLYRAAITRG